MQHHLDKTAVKQALDAVRDVLNHYQQWSMTLEMRCEERTPQLTRSLSDMRQLRGKIQDGVSSSGELDIELSQKEDNALVSCLLFSAEGLIIRLHQCGSQPHLLRRLKEQINALFDLTTEFASLPVELVRSPMGAGGCSQDLGRMVESINKRVSGGVENEPTPSPDLILQDLGAPVQMDSSATPHEPRMSPAKPPDISFAPRQPINPVGLDLRLVRDERLRSLLTENLQSLATAMKANDVRLSAMMLGSVFEATVADLVLQRAARDIPVSPDTWALEEVVPRLLGRPCTAPERSTLDLLMSCRDLIRPTAQLAKPIRLTPKSVNGIRGFVKSFVQETGMSSVGSTV